MPDNVASTAWHPIATVPKDGSLVLLGRFVPEPCKANRNKYVAVDKYDKRWSGGWAKFGRQWPPTHWTNLPAYPEVDNGDSRE